MQTVKAGLTEFLFYVYFSVNQALKQTSNRDILEAQPTEPVSLTWQ